MKIQPISFRQNALATGIAAPPTKDEKTEQKTNNNKTRNIALLGLAALGVAGILIGISRGKNTEKAAEETLNKIKETPKPPKTGLQKTFSLLDDSEISSVMDLSGRFLSAKNNPENALIPLPSSVCVEIKDAAKRQQILEHLENLTGARLVKKEQSEIIGDELLDALEKQGSEAEAFHALTGRHTIFYIGDLEQIIQKEEKTLAPEVLTGVDARRNDIFENAAQRHHMTILFDNDSDNLHAADHYVRARDPMTMLPRAEDLLGEHADKLLPKSDIEPQKSSDIKDLVLDAADDVLTGEILGHIL